MAMWQEAWASSPSPVAGSGHGLCKRGPWGENAAERVETERNLFLKVGPR